MPILVDTSAVFRKCPTTRTGRRFKRGKKHAERIWKNTIHYTLTQAIK